MPGTSGGDLHEMQQARPQKITAEAVLGVKVEDPVTVLEGELVVEPDQGLEFGGRQEQGMQSMGRDAASVAPRPGEAGEPVVSVRRMPELPWEPAGRVQTETMLPKESLVAATQVEEQAGQAQR